jgi:hypothetical protein
LKSLKSFKDSKGPQEKIEAEEHAQGHCITEQIQDLLFTTLEIQSNLLRWCAPFFPTALLIAGSLLDGLYPARLAQDLRCSTDLIGTTYHSLSDVVLEPQDRINCCIRGKWPPTESTSIVTKFAYMMLYYNYDLAGRRNAHSPCKGHEGRAYGRCNVVYLTIFSGSLSIRYFDRELGVRIATLHFAAGQI